MRYIASDELGLAAFSGGLATALLRAIIHYGICLVIAGVFILSANQRPLLRRNAILCGLLYGVATYIVMDFLVAPLSAAPKADIMSPAIMEGIIGHALAIGLLLAIIIRRMPTLISSATSRSAQSPRPPTCQ